MPLDREALAKLPLLKTYHAVRRIEQEAAESAMRVGGQLVQLGMEMSHESDRGPFEGEVQKGAAALLPFVERWRLALNPEQLEEIAFAVLRNAYRDGDGERIYEEIERSSNQQLDEFAERWTNG